MTDELTVEFLDWLTESGRMRLRYQSNEGEADELWLGDKQVSRSDLARVARHWSGGHTLCQETAGALVESALQRLSASPGRRWRPAE